MRIVDGTLALGERIMLVVSQSIVVPVIVPISMLATPNQQHFSEGYDNELPMVLSMHPVPVLHYIGYIILDNPRYQ